MNIIIDGRVWSKNGAGVTTFFNSAIAEWAKQWSEDCFYIVLPKGLDPSNELPPLPDNVKLLDYSGRFPRRLPNLLIIQGLMPYLCKKLHADIYYAPIAHMPFLIPSRTRTLITVHDVVNIEMKETMDWKNRLATSFFFNWTVKHAQQLWTNSYYTKSKVEEYFPKRKCKDIFVGNAAERRLYYPQQLSEEQKSQIRAKHGIKGRFILFVGSLEPRKNLAFLLSLMPTLYRKHQVQLVVVGGKGWKNSDLKKTVESPDFPKESTIFCGFLSNQELVELYNTADCFVSAALMEGFGMPQLEALLCGCPVVTSHNTAMIEVAKDKDGATTVEGYRPQDWEQAIIHALDTRPIVKQNQFNEYDWKTIIQNLTKLYDKQ